MLQYLVERLPLMVCPKWVLTKSQPIAVDDVVEYLVRSIETNETKSKTFDIGGPEILTYLDMMQRYGKILKKSIKIIIIPFLTPRLSSYWVDLITPVKASLARPLIDSLKHEAIVKDNTIADIIPLRLKNFENSIKIARYEQLKTRE
jgi:Predicted nucleoside-diphosphate-sugar epimerases